jgi:hypothetical protein
MTQKDKTRRMKNEGYQKLYFLPQSLIYVRFSYFILHTSYFILQPSDVSLGIEASSGVIGI